MHYSDSKGRKLEFNQPYEVQIPPLDIYGLWEWTHQHPCTHTRVRMRTHTHTHTHVAA